MSDKQQWRHVPQFGVKETSYRGRPVLEILADGRPFGETFQFDKNFQFGVVKAEMILTCKSILEKFVQTGWKGSKLPSEFKVIGKIDINVRVFKRFQTSWGETINRPYLELSFGNTKIGLGIEKAKAILDSMSDIEVFIKKYS